MFKKNSEANFESISSESKIDVTGVEVNGEEIIEDKVVPLHIIVVVTSGLDHFNPDFDDTYVHVNVSDNATLESMHERIISRLSVDHDDDLIYTKGKDNYRSLRMQCTLRELNIVQGDILYLKLLRPRRFKKPRTRRDLSVQGLLFELVCVTRVGVEGDSLRKLKVLVQPNHLCYDMIEEVSNFWGRSGLKFKCGRTVLKPDKTFMEQGVVHGSEIVVTGGRL